MSAIKGKPSFKRRTGKITACKVCNKKFYCCKYRLKENNFCSRECAEIFQKRNKLQFVCKTCGEVFYRSPSWTKGKKGDFCSIQCRNQNKEWLYNACYIGNQIQNMRKGLNRFELKGNEILNKMSIKYENQVLINNKICVDVFIKDYNLIIQFDGEYWHGKDTPHDQLDKRQLKRVNLDKSQDSYLKKCGYQVLRFWDDDLMKKEEFVIENITRTIQQITR